MTEKSRTDCLHRRGRTATRLQEHPAGSGCWDLEPGSGPQVPGSLCLGECPLGEWGLRRSLLPLPGHWPHLGCQCWREADCPSSFQTADKSPRLPGAPVARPGVGGEDASVSRRTDSKVLVSFMRTAQEQLPGLCDQRRQDPLTIPVGGDKGTWQRHFSRGGGPAATAPPPVLSF